jgi:hypothetical protein
LFKTNRFTDLHSDPLVNYVLLDTLTAVLGPATKLWNTGRGADRMREAVSLLGGYGLMEDGPGFLGQKWMDTQLEATYEGPEVVHRRQLSLAMVDDLFLARYRLWIGKMRRIGEESPGTGACALATAMELWLWSLQYLLRARDADGSPLYRDYRHGVTFPMADVLGSLLASVCQVLDLRELRARLRDDPDLVAQGEAVREFFSDLTHVQVAQAAAETGSVCAELVFGYNRHPAWEDPCESCFRGDELDSLEALIPGIAASGIASGDVIEADGSHPAKAGPCVRFRGMTTFNRLREKLSGCLTGARLAKDRAARSITELEVPQEPDYPLPR